MVDEFFIAKVLKNVAACPPLASRARSGKKFSTLNIFHDINASTKTELIALYQRASMSELPNYINGEFVTPQGVQYVDVTSPATEEVIAKVPLNSAQTVDVAVAAANRAFPEWSGLTIKQRAAIMFKFHHLVEQHSQELAELIVKENGKNIVEALADVAKGNETAEWACSLPQIVQGKILEVSKGISCQENRVPLGVVGAIVPFNFPAMVP
eukprot:gene13192-16131_t